jgi:polygalacturonase
MRRAHLVAALMIVALTNVRAQSARFPVDRYGATADGHTNDTAAINKAIQAAKAAGGGTVVFDAGTYLACGIRLESHVALFVDHGAVIEAGTPETTPCDAPEPNQWDRYQDFGHSHWHNSLIWGEDLDDVAIYGTGTLYGKGLDREAEPTSPAGTGNKAIALKSSRNVTLRDITIRHGGHFAILATGVDNFTVDNVKMDTNRDGIDVDACRNVRLSNVTVNSPYDDGICLKSSYALGVARATENVTITNCQVSGYDEGSYLDGTFTRTGKNGSVRPTGAIGRIKFGTESSGGFKNIAITNSVFSYSRGLAIETVDGGPIEDVTIDNIAMHDVIDTPLFVRRGNRARTPGAPPPGVIRRVAISHLVASGVDGALGIVISGLPGYPIEDLRLSDVRVEYAGGGTKEDAARVPAEKEKAYPEPDMFGRMPSYALFARHVAGLDVRDADVSFAAPELRPAIQLQDVVRVDLDHIRAQRPGTTTRALLPTVRLDKVDKASY